MRKLITICAILGLMLATPPAEAVLDPDIDAIIMTSCKEYLDGAAYTDPWGFEIWVQFADVGTLHHIDVTPPGSGLGPFTIYEDGDGYWNYDSPSSYSDLAGLQTDYPTGTYGFSFEDASDIVLRTFSLGYSGLSEPANPVNFTSPAHGATNVSLSPTLSWTVSESDGDALAIWVWDAVTDEDIYENVPAPMTETSLAPGPLAAGHNYELEISVIDVKDLEAGPAFPTMNVSGDEFVYGLWIEYLNYIEFTTVPEPATVALLSLGSLILVRRKRRA